MSAAAAWDALAAELSWAATGYASAISELTSGPWVGPASASMVAALGPYVTWLSVTAEQAECAGIQAKRAAAAYETAFMMTVPPPMVAANRALLMTLIGANFFGQNTPAIAATEAEYAQMWAQDAAAMYGYARSSATASAFQPFTPPPNAVSAAGLAEQAVAVGLAATTPAGTAEPAIAAMLPQLISSGAIPAVLQQLSTISSVSWFWGFLQWLETTLSDLTIANRTTIVRLLGESYFWIGIAAFFNAIAQTLVPGTPATAGGAGSSVADAWGPTLAAGLGMGPGNPGGAAGGLAALSAHSAGVAHVETASAVLGKARCIGSLSTPPSWPLGGSAEPVGFAGEEPVGILQTGPGAGPVDGFLRGLLPNGAGHGSGGFVHRYGFRYKVVARPPCAG